MNTSLWSISVPPTLVPYMGIDEPWDVQPIHAHTSPTVLGCLWPLDDLPVLPPLEATVQTDYHHSTLEVSIQPEEGRKEEHQGPSPLALLCPLSHLYCV